MLPSLWDMYGMPAPRIAPLVLPQPAGLASSPVPMPACQAVVRPAAPFAATAARRAIPVDFIDPGTASYAAARRQQRRSERLDGREASSVWSQQTAEASEASTARGSVDEHEQGAQDRPGSAGSVPAAWQRPLPQGVASAPDWRVAPAAGGRAAARAPMPCNASGGVDVLQAALPPRMRRFDDALRAAHGLRLVPIPADGNCLYSAAALQLYGDAAQDRRVREAVFAYMRGDFDAGGARRTRQHFDALARASEGLGLGAYLELMGQPGRWGGYPELLAMEELYDRPVHLFYVPDAPEAPGAGQPLGAGVQAGAPEARGIHFGGELPAAALAGVTPLRFAYRDGMHYDAVLPVDGVRVRAVYPDVETAYADDAWDLLGSADDDTPTPDLPSGTAGDGSTTNGVGGGGGSQAGGGARRRLLRQKRVQCVYRLPFVAEWLAPRPTPGLEVGAGERHMSDSRRGERSGQAEETDEEMEDGAPDEFPAAPPAIQALQMEATEGILGADGAPAPARPWLRLAVTTTPPRQTSVIADARVAAMPCPAAAAAAVVPVADNSETAAAASDVPEAVEE
jgi:uncharacterized membrane protein YgcG